MSFSISSIDQNHSSFFSCFTFCFKPTWKNQKFTDTKKIYNKTNINTLPSSLNSPSTSSSSIYSTPPIINTPPYQSVQYISSSNSSLSPMARRDYQSSPGRQDDQNQNHSLTDFSHLQMDFPPIQQNQSPSINDTSTIVSSNASSPNLSSSPSQFDLDLTDLNYPEYTTIVHSPDINTQNNNQHFTSDSIMTTPQHSPQIPTIPPSPLILSNTTLTQLSPPAINLTQSTDNDLDFINSFVDEVMPLSWNPSPQLQSNPMNTDIPSFSPLQTSIVTAQKSQTTLLDLPNELIDLIIRHLSSKPKSLEPIWDDKLDTIHTMNFASTCKRMLNIFKSRIITIRTRPERYREDLLYMPPSSGIILDAKEPADVSHLACMLRLAGPSLQELFITKSLSNFSWVDSYVSSVSNLRKLSLRDVNSDYPLEAILKASSRSLKHLEIAGETGKALSVAQLHSIATHCSSVHTLTLRLSLFEHDWTPVWMGIGPGLTRLSLGATRFWILDAQEIGLLEQISRYCCDINQLHFYHLGAMLGEACSKLCARYGDQLEKLELEQSQMVYDHLQAIANHCPNARLSISHGSSVISHTYNTDIVQLLGPQIDSLRYRSRIAHDESLEKVAEHCTNLKELRLDCASSVPDVILSELLFVVGRKLEKLSMNFFVNSRDDSTIAGTVNSALNTLGECVEHLRELSLGGRQFDIDQFGKIIKRCKKTLKKVSVTFGFRTAEENQLVELSTIVSLVRKLHEVDDLKQLTIIDRTSSRYNENCVELEEACYPLRANAERIVICGVAYIK